MPPTREQLDAMCENIRNLLTTIPQPEPDGTEDEPNLAVYSYVWQQSWLDMDDQLRWRPCSEAMPTEPGEYECVVGGPMGTLRTLLPLSWDRSFGFHARIDAAIFTYRVTHWRPWAGWPGEEGK